ncbi:MAG: helix-turn-helix domain-containing protein [Acidobacteriia bacterium]|nr:helix-turn-helix domain-containing protein [Terriglobia bacterium]
MARDKGPYTTITTPEIAQRLGLSEETVYGMLKAGEIPNIRRRHLFIVSRTAYEQWEATIGNPGATSRPVTITSGAVYGPISSSQILSDKKPEK